MNCHLNSLNLNQMSTEQKRRALKTISFKESGTFEGLYAAQKWLKENGYEYGSLCGHDPVAITKGIYDLPQKWINFNKLEKSLVDGVMLSTDFREGEVTVILYKL